MKTRRFFVGKNMKVENLYQKLFGRDPNDIEPPIGRRGMWDGIKKKRKTDEIPIPQEIQVITTVETPPQQSFDFWHTGKAHDEEPFTAITGCMDNTHTIWAGFVRRAIDRGNEA